MLELKNITKDYITGDSKVEALKGISIKFRDSEFVSVLGPSGCGKTTLLNIIGGLDRYTSGDLIINGKSTKDFKDRDWDAYRNYSVGFVFQNYNLISHQTILSNVELALTISGVSKKERRRMAIEALKDVGLLDQIHKKPNQLSGGQMQRVAIARALVNNPDIILADEPTGALDTKTSVQVMNILKKIAKEKLIIMVTHNPVLANDYSSRIVKILDGEIIEDSNPVSDDSKVLADSDSSKRVSMNFKTAFMLSLNNLMTKKGRTILTSFAGSIGIIGIALILAISTGVQNYIDKVEEDTLSSYPITIEETTVDMSSMVEGMMEDNDDGEERDKDKIYSSNVMDEVLTTLSTKVRSNNLRALKEYINDSDNDIIKSSNAIKYGYNFDINLYKTDTSDGIVRVNPSTVMESMGYGFDSNDNMNTSVTMGFASDTGVFKELLDNDRLLKSSYDLVAGSWPKKYNELVLIVDKNNEISDYTLYTLGLKNQEELAKKMEALQRGEKLEKEDISSYSYDDLLSLSYKLVLNSDYFYKSGEVWIDKRDDDKYMKDVIDKALNLKIVGIIRQNDQTISQSETGRIGYTKELTEYVIDKVNDSSIVKEQKDNKDINVFTGTKFGVEMGDFNYSNYREMSADELKELIELYSSNASATYDNNLSKLGVVDKDNPSTISIYPKNFEDKEKIVSAIDKYNKKQKKLGKEENVINYTDIVGLMMKSVSQIINTISYVLIAFVGISLIVSSIMIGIITYISVLERTKEIGILRSIGASKKDISRVFNAETLIIGLASGLIGIGVTVLLTIPLNKIIYGLTGVRVITRVPVVAGIILIIISVVLTIIAGLIPSSIASKKDPVIALRID